MTGAFWGDIAITIATAVLSALAARYGWKMPTPPTPTPKPEEKKTEPKTPGKE